MVYWIIGIFFTITFLLIYILAVASGRYSRMEIEYQKEIVECDSTDGVKI